MLKRIPSLDVFINEAAIWDDSYGNPSKLHKELYDIVQKSYAKKYLGQY
jgi:hypothetical protein